ncbi:hypothetical protein QQS21_005922 [Conoideocrella luteorostrata]|uniref:Uncharacterized protein n=1 Tax=Conoideocrella luteorostrata TaxID=1105319 RepID=A0AAJ0CNH7_9HYPO|nr:hypothetical protein QQS21_005922 [Conoideocrella luteorostrata]
MESQLLWPGQLAEPLECPSSIEGQSNVPTDLVPPSSTDRSWIPTRPIQGPRRQHPSSRENWKRPIEFLVQRLKRHSLRNQDDHIGGGTVHSDLGFNRHRKVVRVPRRHGDDMDVDEHPEAQINSTESTTMATEMAQSSTHGSSPYDPCASTQPQLFISDSQVESQSSARKSPPSALPNIYAALGHGTSSAVNSEDEFAYDYLLSDEGYCDNLGELAGEGDGHNLIRSLARHARTSGVLQYRTSAEAALQCHQVVQRAPRMRRRRHRKHQTRLRASSTATGSTCGFDGQIALDSKNPES